VDNVRPEAECGIVAESDLLRVRQLLRSYSTLDRDAGERGLVDRTKLVTAGSELARNILKYAGPAGGRMRLELVQSDQKRGVSAVFSDAGPGIVDIGLAMKDGYSTSGSLGLGLPGARRLVDQFSISSDVGHGTTVTVVKWIR
jgi:serine/threonine-protein kinase RsbT